MAYYYSNQQQNFYHYHPIQSYQTNLNYDNYYTNTHPIYPQYYNTNHFSTTYDYYYDTTNPTQSTTNIVDDHVSAEIATFHVVDKTKDDDDDEDMEDNHKKHFHGGYNMSETYGKPLPPSDEICYPPSKVEVSTDIGHFSYDSIASPYGKDGQKHAENEAKHANNEVVLSEPIEEVEEEEEEEEESSEDDGGGGDGKEMVVRRQIPPGYGIEAVDLCEGVFGGYFPCLWKRIDNDKRNDNKISYYNEDSEYNYWKGTADYLFGNPNPYGGSMVEKGSYGDPIYCYHRYSPQQSICEQVEY